MKELLSIAAALEELCAGSTPAALATVVRVSGSAYRKPGARILMTAGGERSWGIVSGGCLERDLVERARVVLAEGRPRLVRYDGTTAEDAVFGTGAGCPGVVDVLLEPVSPATALPFAGFIRGIAARRAPGTVETNLSAGRLGERQLYAGEPRHAVPGGSGERLVEVLHPPVQLVIFGDWLDVAPLLRIGAELGWQTAVVDVRRRPLSTERFAQAGKVLTCGAGEAVQRLAFDRRTAAVVMNHHLEHDRESLKALLPLKLPYLGLLGPRRRTGPLLNELGADASAVRGPVGLDIGAEGPEEIALSIAAEIVSLFSPRRAP